VTAIYPATWQVQQGLATEALLFSVSDPLKPALRYTVTELAVPADGVLEPLAFQRNIQRGGQLSMYRIFEQSPAEYQGNSAYTVHFAYVDPRETTSLPLVVEGIEYYLNYPASGRVLLVTLEDDAHSFTVDQQGFQEFLDSIHVSGGAK